MILNPLLNTLKSADDREFDSLLATIQAAMGVRTETRPDIMIGLNEVETAIRHLRRALNG